MKVIYIMGAGRSGSTILGIILGNLDNCFYAGELSSWNKRKGKPNSNDKSDLLFWTSIKNKILTQLGYYYSRKFYRLEHHTGIKNIIKLKKKYLLNEYSEFNFKLFSLIKKTKNINYIIDSSHYPLRAYLLNKIPNIELYLIYLTRNPYKIVNSFQKKKVEQPPKSVLFANFYLLGVTIESEIIYRIVGDIKKIKLKYEDIINNRETFCERISNFLDIKKTIISFNDLKVEEMFEGNRIRKKDKIDVRSKTYFSDISIMNKILTSFINRFTLHINKY